MATDRERGTARRERRLHCAGRALLSGLIVAIAQGSPEAFAEKRERGSCVVCERPIDGEASRLRRDGRELWLHPGECMARWNEDPERYFRNFQARGALFDEESTRGGSGYGWLALGLYVLLGLVCGALASYLAVSRGHPPGPWFFLGLAFNGLALLAVAIKSPGDTTSFPAGVPRGLRKVPTTRAPVDCPSCGSANHPAARTCSSCGAETVSAATTETSHI